MDQIAGHIIRMTKSNGQLLTCSLWLRQQETQGRHILIWIFELIDELYITLELNQDQITKAEGQTMNMFGYHEDELVDCPVSLLIPHLESPIDWNVCNIKKYYTGQSHRGVTFPVWIHKDQNTLKIRSLPNMAGCLVIDTHGLVTSINNVFSKNLFGISSQEMQQMQVSHLLPDFWDFFNSRSPKTLYYDDLDKGRMTSPLEMKSPIGLFPTHRRITMLTNRKDTSPMTLGTAMVAKHRDGTEIQVNVHIRPCSGTMIGFHLVWIAFNHHEYHGVRLSASPTPDDLPDSLQQLDLSRKARESQSRDSLKELPRTPPKRWQFYESLGLFQMQDLIGDFKILSDIGEGAYGYVKLGVSKKDPFKNKVVLKYVVKSKVLNWCRRPDIGGRVPLEASTMFDISSIPHPNVCRLLTMFQDEFFFYILMPYEPTMDLFDYIETRDIPQEDIRTIFAQVVSGLQHLHKNGIVHRDIKASRDENVIINDQKRCQIIDFGSASKISTGPFNTFFGTMDFCAPEVLQGDPYTGPPQDLWALGIMLYTLYYKENPFSNLDQLLQQEFKVDIGEDCEGCDILLGLLERDLNKRWTMEQVAVDPWICQLVT